jgi:ribosomal protein S18 acetylase RimI-like enzyme
MYTLRKLGAEDRASFRMLRQLALTVDPGSFVMTAEEECAISRLNIEDALDQPGPANFFVGAFEGSQLVGIAGLITSALHKISHTGTLTSVFVRPEYRRRGLGRLLVERVIQEATSVRSIRLDVVAESKAAIALYESLGFRVYGVQEGAYRLGERTWDLLLMTRDLA